MEKAITFFQHALVLPPSPMSENADKLRLIGKLNLVLENGRWFLKKENTHPALIFTEQYVANHDVLAMLFRANKLCLGKLKYFRANLDKFEPFKYHYAQGFVPVELWDAEFFRHKTSGCFIDFRFLQSITVYEDFVALCEQLESGTTDSSPCPTEC